MIAFWLYEQCIQLSAAAALCNIVSLIAWMADAIGTLLAVKQGVRFHFKLWQFEYVHDPFVPGYTFRGILHSRVCCLCRRCGWGSPGSNQSTECNYMSYKHLCTLLIPISCPAQFLCSWFQLLLTCMNGCWCRWCFCPWKQRKQISKSHDRLVQWNKTKGGLSLLSFSLSQRLQHQLGYPQ